MARIVGPRRIRRYSEEFKATAVRLRGVQVQDVAEALDRGSEYGALAIQQRLAGLGFIQSMPCKIRWG